MLNNKNWIAAGLAAVSLIAVVAYGCGPKEGDAPEGGTDGKPVAKTTDGGGTGSVSIDGSTTVYPIVNIIAEDFGKANEGVKVDVTKSGTGSGFKKFIDGTIDICTASRTIEDKEDAELKTKGMEYFEIPIAYDGVSVIVNPANTFVDKMTVDELKKAWGPDSTVKTWADIRAGWPAEKITFSGPSDNHGTYEYFTEKAVGKKNQIRKEYSPMQEYNQIVAAVAGDKNGFAYVGYSYYIENKDKVKIVPVDGVVPSEATIADGSYKPLSRVLFIYVSKKAYDSKPEVKKFVEYALGEGLGAVKESQYVDLPKEAIDLVKERISGGKTGSIFAKAEAGKTTVDILKAAK